MSLPFEQSRHICRIVDVRNGIYAGTVVLVSGGGGQSGYALTCWHNFDPRHRLTINEDTPIDDVFLIPNADPVEAPEHRRPVIVVARWSNVHMDVAVLKIPRAVIVEFDLHPMPITFDLYRGMRLSVIGFQRPDHLRHPDGVNVKVVALDQVVRAKDWKTELRLFEVTSLDGKTVPYHVGMSGGAMIDIASHALVGLAYAVGPNETGNHRSLGYGVSIDTIARGWPQIDEYCQVRRADRWKWWLQRAAIGVMAAAALAALMLVLPPVICWMRSCNMGRTPPDFSTLSVHLRYTPSGKVGDVGDLDVDKGAVAGGGDRFTYETKGAGPREWRYTDDPMADLNRPARFAGVTYLSPADCWGLTPNCGYDLRRYGRLHWEARSANALTPRVEFLIDTDNQTWSHENGALQSVRVPYPGGPTRSFGTYSLSQTWQSFALELGPAQDRCRVIGGFGWMMTWAANGVEANGLSPRQVKTFIIEIRRIRYEQSTTLRWPRVFGLDGLNLCGLRDEVTLPREQRRVGR